MFILFRRRLFATQQHLITELRVARAHHCCSAGTWNGISRRADIEINYFTTQRREFLERLYYILTLSYLYPAPS